jgi:hypothetical protein
MVRAKSQHFTGAPDYPVKESLRDFGICNTGAKVPNLNGMAKDFLFPEQLDEGFKISVGKQKLGY